MHSILVIDNYDSFTWNLVHYLQQLDCIVTVKRNDALNVMEVEQYDQVLLSPGPGLPKDAGCTMEVIAQYSSVKPILGVCLGHQAIAQHFGGTLENLPNVRHGIAEEIRVTDAAATLFRGLPQTFKVGRYHSWTVAKELPEALVATSLDAEGNIMSLRHRTMNVCGIQFHPESIMTHEGLALLRNWVEVSKV